MNTHKLTFAALAVIAIALTLAIAPAFINQAFAKITEEPVACENPRGQEPGGQQQPVCKGAGQTQITENQNPAGKALPGKNL